MAIGVKNYTAKAKTYTYEQKKNSPAKTNNNDSNKDDDTDNNPIENHISDKVEISSEAKAAHKHANSHAFNESAGTKSQAGSNSIAQVSQNDAHTNTQMLLEQLAVSGGDSIQAIIDELMAANDNALQAFIKELLAANENTLQTLLEELLGTSGNSHILDFIATIMAPDRNDNDNSGSSIDDPTRRLTRRLVIATTAHEIHGIISEAQKSLGEAILAAANGDEGAKQILRRLNRLIRRATRKISDLNGEDQLRRRETRARERDLEKLARQLELELRQRLAERKRRERGYLRDKDDDENNVLPIPGTLSSGSLTAAQIKAMAWQAAKAAIATQAGAPAVPVGSIGGGSVGGGMGGEASLSGGVAAGGGEAVPSGDAA